MGRQQGALSIQKNEKITRTVPILKLQFYIFSKIDIKIFTNGAGGFFFLHITILFHQCNNKNIIY